MDGSVDRDLLDQLSVTDNVLSSGSLNHVAFAPSWLAQMLTSCCSIDGKRSKRTPRCERSVMTWLMSLTCQPTGEPVRAANAAS